MLSFPMQAIIRLMKPIDSTIDFYAEKFINPLLTVSTKEPVRDLPRAG